jgi:hypothetical protein
MEAMEGEHRELIIKGIEKGRGMGAGKHNIWLRKCKWFHLAWVPSEEGKGAGHGGLLGVDSVLAAAGNT